MACIAVPGTAGLWLSTAGTNGYVIVRQGKSLLIDCPSTTLGEELSASRLPTPSLILHTQVQEEHCREWAAFPQVPVAVAAGCCDMALCSPSFFADCRTVWPPSREWETRGAEKYGIAGCTTERPPAHALRVMSVFAAGDVLRWADGVTLEVLALPGSGKRAVGFYWREEAILFSGDLIVEGGHLANLYDCERDYGTGSGLREVAQTLASVSALQPRLLLPATGSPIVDPDTACRQLQQRLTCVLASVTVPPEVPVPFINYAPRREMGRYREVAPGIIQSNNGGNVILFIDAEGRGCIIDPDPCVWLPWEESCQAVHADLDLLECEAGLRGIELALITHYHGDHLQFCDLLRARYGTRVAAAPDVAAIMERPWDYRYPCGIDWYGFPFDHVPVDLRLCYEHPFDFHGVPITAFPTPGHCGAHSGFFLPWQGRGVACTGDTLQYGGGPIHAMLPIIYNDAAYPALSTAVTLRRLLALQPDLVLGGHSFSFFDSAGVLLRQLLAAEEAFMPLLAELLPAGQLTSGMTPPGYDEKRVLSAEC